MADVVPSTASHTAPAADTAPAVSSPHEALAERSSTSGSASAMSPSTTRKRSRSPDASHPDPSPEQARKRQRPAIDEKTRTRRLFGGLLSGPAGPRAARTDTSSRASAAAAANNTLTGGPSEATLARRASIEARKRSELAARDEEIAVVQKAKLVELQRRRRRRQELLDERDREREWDARVLRAGYLRTRGEGGIYFSPWKMTEEQEDEVRGRKAEVEREVEEDRERWRAEKAGRDAETMEGDHEANGRNEEVKDAREESNRTTNDRKEALENGGEAANQHSATDNVVDSAMPDCSTTQPVPEERKHRSGSPSPSEDDGQDGVDNGEDTVMY